MNQQRVEVYGGHFLGHLLRESFSLYETLPVKERRRVVEKVLLYLFRASSSASLSKTLKPLCGNVKKFRLGLMDSGRVFRLKAYIWYCVSKRKKVRPGKFALRSEDKRILTYLRKGSRLREYLDGCTDTYEAYKHSELQSILGSIALGVRLYTTKFVKRKMRFIIQGNGYDVDDFVNELVAKGIRGVMSTYPCMDSELHAMNICKKSIHNAGINLIKHWTAKSRGVLIKNSDGTFSSKKVSLDVLPSGASSGTVTEYAHTSASGTVVLGMIRAGSVELENRSDVGTILARHEGKEKRLLMLLCGSVDMEFTRFLRSAGFIQSEDDNEDLYTKALRSKSGLNRYIRLCSNYLRWNYERVKFFLLKIKYMLGGSRRLALAGY